MNEFEQGRGSDIAFWHASVKDATADANFLVIPQEDSAESVMTIVDGFTAKRLMWIIMNQDTIALRRADPSELPGPLEAHLRHFQPIAGGSIFMESYRQNP